MSYAYLMKFRIKRLETEQIYGISPLFQINECVISFRNSPSETIYITNE